MKKLELGMYQHYKGMKYLVLGTAKHSETLEEMAVYVTLYENEESALWVRPLKMFLETVVINGQAVERFKKID